MYEKSRMRLQFLSDYTQSYPFKRFLSVLFIDFALLSSVKRLYLLQRSTANAGITYCSQYFRCNFRVVFVEFILVLTAFDL